MADASGSAGASADTNVTRRIVVTGAVLAVAVAIATVLVFRHIAEERDRELLTWQTRLGIVASSRAAAVEDWIERQFDEIESLAINPTVSLYLTETALGEAAEAAYLANLLAVTAARTGFEAPPLGPDVRANVERIGVAGIVLYDMAGRPLVGTPEPPAAEGALRAFIESLAGERRGDGERALLDIYRAPSGLHTMAFALPIFGIQDEPTPENQIGFAVGIKPVAAELFPLLKQPGAVERTAEVLLLRRSGDVVEYLSPLADGTAPLARKLAVNTPDLAAAFALAHPGGFAEARDYRGEPVLAVGRGLSGAPWTLMHKIDAAEALGSSDARLRRLMVIFLLAIGFTAAGMIAVWFKGASYRAAAAAGRFEEMATRFEQQRDFLQLVSDSQPNSITVIDADGKCRFANSEAAARAGMAPGEMLDRSLVSIVGADKAKRYAKLNREAIEDGTAATAMHRIEDEGLVRHFESRHVPLAGAADIPRGVLLVESDITEAITERERRERTLRQVVDTLVTAVDRRDHNAGHHSARVARVAAAVAGEMGLDATSIETAEIAGRLMNLGKILVPVELLTKQGQLSTAEIGQVRQSIQAGADLLQGVEFNGPVAETLRQCQERWDGSGTPQGLAGEAILVPARVVAVANAFVAMISPRAHRAGLDFDRVSESLAADAGKAWDHRVVTALDNYLENRDGRREWAEFLGGA